MNDSAYTFCEGDLEFDFSGCQHAERFDKPGVPRPHGMSLVDFVVEESERTLLIEVKAPSDPNAPATVRQSWTKKLRKKPLINESLVPKCRDSYAYLHLMERDSRPMLFIACLGLSKVKHDPALLVAFKQNLLAKLKKEADQPWKRHYVDDCIVVTDTNWSQHLRYRLSRLSNKQMAP